MRRKIEELKDTLNAFVEQRERPLLVVGCADPEIVYILKALEGMDDGAPSDIFLTFGEPFHGGTSYATAIVNNLHAQMEMARAPRAARGVDPLPALPALCYDESVAAPMRVRTAIHHISSLSPAREGHRVIWGFLPLQITDAEGYARLVAEFIPWKGPETWMRGLRVIVRDNRRNPFLVAGLRENKAPGVLIYEMDMSPAALSDALVKDASDRSLPKADRMQALMQLAGLDYAYKRYSEALAKYQRLNEFYAEQEVPAMQALALQGIGDVHRQKGELRNAKLRYQQGLTLVMKTQALPILLHLTLAIGEVSLELGDDSDAEGFSALAGQIAEKSWNPYAKAQALENLGIARDRLGTTAGAVAAWRDADTVCQSFGDNERRRSVLARLIDAYRRMSLDEQRRACEMQMASVKGTITFGERAVHHHPLRRAEA